MTFRRKLAKTAVWLTFAWVAVVAGFIVWAKWAHDNNEHEVPTLIAAVDDSVRTASSQDTGLLQKLVLTSRIDSLGDPGATDVLSVVPTVQGAEPFQFMVTDDGGAAIGYRGTSLANDVCVRSVLTPAGTVQTSRASCSVW